jgi:XRE family aerobic/anaerobic benzoate catabolism transcriptional regulator
MTEFPVLFYTMTSASPIPEAAAQQLRLLGSRVRHNRARRGMSRRILATASGVSERYLAQLEAGKGNASVLVLQAISDAMHVAIDDLLDSRPDQSSDYLLLRERLRRANDDELKVFRANCLPSF